MMIVSSTQSDDYNRAASQLLDYKQNKTNKPSTTTTTSQGAPIDSLTSSMTAGPTGPIVLQDFTLLDHLSHFDRERIPERVVHAKGAGALGYFELTHAQPHCRASLFQQVGQHTRVAVRFSTVGGESGSADTARDPRGFAVKFYTDQGNWDLVGNNTPIFFIRDPILFPSFIHTQKRNPQTHLPDANMFWDFISLRPETVHQVSFLFGDRGIPDGYRCMNGYGSHTFKNVSADDTPCYVKYHWKTDQGIRNLTAEQAQTLSASDPNYAIRDLYNAIAQENYPSWTLYVQIMSYQEAQAASFNPFDLTKIWPQAQYPLRPVGRMVLNQNPTNYFAQIEQLAFSPSHMIPGIEPSPDKMLQARLFSYPDTQRHRLGANYANLPVNWARASVQNYQRDGPMQTTDNGGGAPHYFPNSFGGPSVNREAVEHGDSVTGQVARVETGDEDNFSQCRVFYRRVLDEAARERLTDNLAQHIAQVTDPAVRERAVALFTNVDRDYGATIARKLPPIRQVSAVSLTKETGIAKCPYRSRL